MPQNKPHVSAKHWPIINQARSFMANSDLFGRSPYGFTGGDNLADTKHAKLWQDFGYPEQIEFFMHWNMWRRNGLAKRGASLPVNYCWLTNPWIQEGDEKQDTPYTKAFDDHADRLDLWANFRDGDLCQRIGRYGALLLTVADGKQRHEPVDAIRADQIVKIQPLFEGQLEPATFEERKNNPRYDLPVTYTLQSGNVGNRNERTTDAGEIHWTRLIILTEDALGSEIYGIPCNEGGFNALLNWQKVSGSGGEGFWRQAAQRFVLQATGDTGGQEKDPKELDALGEMIAKMFAGFDAIPSVGNYEMKGLNTGTMPNPDGFRQMFLEEYAASMDIPSKMLVGTQTGVKAADEDTAGYRSEMQARRENVITRWVKLYLNWLGLHTTDMQPPAGIKVCWDDLTAPSEEKRLDNAKKRAEINKISVESGGKRVFIENEIRESAGDESIDSLGDWDDGMEFVDVPKLTDE